MKRPTLLALIILLLGGVLWYFLKHRTEEVPPVLSQEPKELPPVLPPTLGDEVLVDYASAETTGRQDLELFNNYLSNVFLLVKKRDTRQYSTNEDLAEFLLGANSYKTPYLSPGSKILNSNGQIIDRWKTPIRVHPVSTNLLELQSAGPDGKHFTDDDIVLK